MGRWLAFIFGLLIGGAAGAGGMFVAFPFVFPPPVVAETAPAVSAEGTGAGLLGSFRFDEMAEGRDVIHWANGTGGIYRDGPMTILRFDDSFEAGPGPNYWVYLNTAAVGRGGSLQRRRRPAQAGAAEVVRRRAELSAAARRPHRGLPHRDGLVRKLRRLYRLGAATVAPIRLRVRAAGEVGAEAVDRPGVRGDGLQVRGRHGVGDDEREDVLPPALRH